MKQHASPIRQTRCWRRARGHPHQRGWTLIETLAAMTVLAVVLGVVVSFIQVLFQAEVTMRSDAELQATVARLGRMLRSDVRRAVRIEFVAEDPANQTLSVAVEAPRAETINYRYASRAIERKTMKDGALTSRDAFRIPRYWDAEWHDHRTPDGGLVELAFTRNIDAPESKTSAFRQVIIRAAIGADERYRRVSIKQTRQTETNSP